MTKSPLTAEWGRKRRSHFSGTSGKLSYVALPSFDVIYSELDDGYTMRSRLALIALDSENFTGRCPPVVWAAVFMSLCSEL